MGGGIGPRRRGRLAVAAVLAATFVVLCGLPYVRWTAHPSLFDDDFLRIGSVRRITLGEALFRPFNEHMAPLFEVVTWVAWRASGRRIVATPGAFLVAAYLAFASTVGLLAATVRRETGLTTAALAAVATFCLSAVSAETVLWFSASSFQWAAASTLAAWYAAAMATGPAASPVRRAWWLAASAMASACAPAFSAIGILAGPLAVIRILATVDRRTALAAIPPAGTALYLLLCEQFRYRDLVSASVGRNFQPVAALWATARAPASVLMPSLLGLPSRVDRLPGWLAAGLTVAGLLGGVAWAIRSRSRPLILGGLALIGGGYLAAYGARARPGDISIFEVGRYHLFPQIGMIWLLAAAAGPRLRRPDGRACRGLLVATALAAALAIPQYPRMRWASDWSFRYPDQPRSLAAAARLEEVCDREGITLAQAMNALEPTRPRWSPQPWPFNPLLHLFAAGPPVARVPDPLVRPFLIAALTPDDREAIWGGMEATRYRAPAGPIPADGAEPAARLVDLEGVVPIGEGRFLARGWPCHLEYEVDPMADLARSICLPGLRSVRPVEVWWASGPGDWTSHRSVRWIPDPDNPAVDWAVPLDRLPHWRPGLARRLRVVFRDSGPVGLGPPRFLP